MKSPLLPPLRHETKIPVTDDDSPNRTWSVVAIDRRDNSKRLRHRTIRTRQTAGETRHDTATEIDLFGKNRRNYGSPTHDESTDRHYIRQSFSISSTFQSIDFTTLHQSTHIHTHRARYKISDRLTITNFRSEITITNCSINRATNYHSKSNSLKKDLPAG